MYSHRYIWEKSCIKGVRADHLPLVQPLADFVAKTLIPPDFVHKDSVQAATKTLQMVFTLLLNWIAVTLADIAQKEPGLGKQHHCLLIIPIQNSPPKICCSHSLRLPLLIFTVASLTCLFLACCFWCELLLCNFCYLEESPVSLHIAVFLSCFVSLLGLCLIMLVFPFSFSLKSLIRLTSESCVNFSFYSLV